MALPFYHALLRHDGTPWKGVQKQGVCIALLRSTDLCGERGTVGRERSLVGEQAVQQPLQQVPLLAQLA